MNTSGWVAFSGIMLFMAGLFGAIDGLVAIIHDEVYFVGDDQVILMDISAWGWVHLLVGIGVLATGLSILNGQSWAFVVGIIVAVFHATTQLMFITVFPWWSIAIIAIDVLVIYGLVVHGEKAMSASGMAEGEG